jgi:hypothetical protein
MPDVSKLIPQITMPLSNVRFVKDTDFVSVVGLLSFDRIAATVEGVLTIKTVGAPASCTRAQQLFVNALYHMSYFSKHTHTHNTN